MWWLILAERRWYLLLRDRFFPTERRSVVVSMREVCTQGGTNAGDGRGSWWWQSRVREGSRWWKFYYYWHELLGVGGGRSSTGNDNKTYA